MWAFLVLTDGVAGLPARFPVAQPALDAIAIRWTPLASAREYPGEAGNRPARRILCWGYGPRGVDRRDLPVAGCLLQAVGLALVAVGVDRFHHDPISSRTIGLRSVKCMALGASGRLPQIGGEGRLAPLLDILLQPLPSAPPKAAR